MAEFTAHIDNKLIELAIGRNLLSHLTEFDLSQTVLLVDENVYKHHEIFFEGSKTIVIPSGEDHKTLTYSEEVFRKLIGFEIDRSSRLIGIGGGLVTDLAGFIASTYMRGITFGFISSTLLGQVDASIGGKNGVNLDGFKNMIGIIRQPDFVWCDLNLLNTLPKAELRSGYAEIIKYGAIKDELLFKKLENHAEHLLDPNIDVLEEIITTCAQIKIDVVASDVYERGERKLLNFGHTLGHAIEKLTGILHGEAVAVGMVIAAKISVKTGYFEEQDFKRLKMLIEKVGLPTGKEIPMTEIYDVLLKDKKRRGSSISMILLNSIGNAFIEDIELSELKRILNDLY